MRSGNLVIMVIDNNYRLDIQDELQQSGCQIITKHNLSQAIEDVADFTNRARPDLILLETDHLPAEEAWMVGALREATQYSDLPLICLGEGKVTDSLQVASLARLNKLVKQGERGQLTMLINKLLSRNPLAVAANNN